MGDNDVQGLILYAFDFDTMLGSPVDSPSLAVIQTSPQKRCAKCKRFLPATNGYFHKNSRRKYGLSSYCKECAGTTFDIDRPEQREGYKQCTKCREFLPATAEYFHRNKNVKCGLVSKCKECVNPYVRAYQSRPEIQEHRHELGKNYNSRPEIKEYKKAMNKAYNSLPEVQEHGKAYRKIYNRKPEVKARMQVHVQTRIARKKEVKGTYTTKQILEQLKRQKYRCYYAACGHAKFKKVNGRYVYDIDHTYPLSRAVGTDIPANDINYMVLACPSCNRSKHDKFPWEWPEGGRLL